MANTSDSAAWAAWLKELTMYLLLLVIPIWKLIDAYFEYQAKKDQELIEKVVTKALKVALEDIRKDVTELKQARIEDIQKYNETVLNIYKELRK